MTRTDIYNASKNIFSELPDEETFAADMTDNEKANQAFNSIIENKDKYEEMGVTLPETVEEFQAIVTTDPKKKSTNTGSNGSTQTQQSSGSKPAQSSQQGPKVFQPQRVFNSIDEINNYFGYLEGYKNDPAAKAEKQWFDENYANITDEFWKQGGKPLTVQGPPVKQQNTASAAYQSNLPKVGKKSTIDNKEFLKKEEAKKPIPRMSDEELMGEVINEITPAQDAVQTPSYIQQTEIIEDKKAKREEAGEKNKGKTSKQVVSEIEQENFYADNYSKVESLINNGFGTRSNDIDFSKLNVNNRSELEDAYGKLEQDYLEYLQKTDPQEYERVNNEIKGIRSKKGSDINTGERQIIDGFRAKAMDMHNLVNGYVMHEIEKNYDLSGYFGAADALGLQIDRLDKQIKELNIDPSGKGVSPAKAQEYQKLVDQRNKLTTEYNGLDEKFAIPTEVVAKYQDVANRYLDNGVVQNQLNNLDTELAAKKAENMKAAQQRFNDAMSGDYSIVDEFGRTFTNTIGRATVDLVTTAWDIIGEATGDTDYDIWDQMANWGRGYNFEKEKMFGTAQDFSLEQREYSELPLAYRMTGLTASGLASISLSAAGGALGMATGIGSTVGGGMIMLGSALSDNYNEALINGYSGKEAANYASTMAAIEISFESLFPDLKIFDAPGAKKSLLKAVASAPDAKTAFQVFIDNLPAALKTEVKIAGENIVKEGGIEEAGSLFVSDIIKSQFNEQNKDKGQFEVFKAEEYQNSVLGGFLGAETANIIGRLGSAKMPHEESMIFQAAVNPNILLLAERNGIDIPDQMKELIASFNDLDEAMKSKPGYSNLSDDQKAHVVSEIQRMKYLEEQNKKVGIDDKATQEEIANIKSEVDQILTNSITKTKENAVQEPSTEEVLPREQGATSETGGQPQGVGQSVQGQEVAKEGEKVSQEGVDIEQKKKEVINQPLGELPENTEDFTGVGAGYLKNNLWASKKLGKDSKTSLLGNIKNEVLNKGKKVFLYFIDPKLSKGKLDTDNKYNTKLTEKINAQGNKTLSGAENAAIENEVGAELAQEGVKAELVSDEKDGTYRIFDTKNTDLLGYIEATPELVEKLSDPNISEEEAQKILFDEAGVQMGDNVLIHANENDLSKYKTQKDVEAAAVPAGKKLFNEPNPETAQISDEYKKAKGIEEGPGSNITKLDTDRAMKIADAYDQMEDTPNDPEVQKAYQKLADETLDQFNAITDKGYTVELWEGEGEPYANSEEMIKDLKDNKHMYIFSTEQGFGDNPITDEQRKQNKLLEDSKFKDKNGKPLLYNDLFRFVHDFFGHSERGNGFGPVGEENAWDVHARMYTPLARRAMTTETRGQNSWVNFGPQMRNEDGSLKKPSDPGYLKATERRFADQKMGLLPEEFSQIEEAPVQDQEADKKSIADKIRGLKSKGGKLYSAGLGIPVAIWDGAVEIVASAVQAGESVSKALNKAKKYLKDNLKDKYNENVFNKLKEETEKQSGQKSNALNIDVESVRKKDRPGKRISKGLAKKSENKKTIFLETDDISVDYVKKKSPQQFIKNARIISEYPLVKAVRKSKPINTVEDAQEVYDIFVRQVADNLKYLMDEFDPEFKEIATLWYDGANAIANELAEEYGITPEQVAGILASLSPQKDWYQNVRLAELVLMAYKDNPVFSQEMLDYQKSVIEKSLYKDQKSPAKQLKKAEKKYKENKTKANKIALDEAKQKFESAVKDSDDVMSMLEEYIGKKMDQVPEYIQPYMVRTYHEVNTTKDYDIITPDGNKAGIAKKANGDNSKVAWGSYGEIGKAVSIYNNGSSDNITRTLGEMHKIRNFNNNIIDPMSKDGDVTIDTHAVAAALLIPLSGNSKEVGQNFGTGTGNSPAFGIKGLYFAYSDAYALAAKETGLLPRQVQSITWEAVRGLYTKSFKANNQNVNDIKQIWKKYEDGEITIEQARELAKQRAGGINEPTWATGSLIDEPGESDQEENDGARTDGDGSDTVRGKRKQPDGDILTEAVEMLSDAQETGGSEVIKAQKEVAEKLGEEGKKIAEIDRNFDKLADELGFIKTCII